ncbi:Rha family transcriptional regulator [Photobacterium galatheae]|uniref:Rha family transcriptional regulator n=1 Tax=Photobacterium galatheae TaxID=1654360 RepID=UPI000568EAE4|nr:Rha family transcriptional regulator [Photobacterium galatheae]MCM0151633.1 hypothetical protein [Photobacterium galatheae]
MKQELINEEPLVEVLNGKASTTSLMFSTVFEIQHNEVLQKIHAVDYSNAFIDNNFSSVKMVENGVDKEIFYITYDGFSLFLSEFYGRLNKQLVEKYLTEFEFLSDQLLCLCVNGKQLNETIH